MQSIIITLDISLELYAELGEYLSVLSVRISSHEIPAVVIRLVPFYELIFCSCSNKQVYSQVRTQEKQMGRAKSQLGAPNKEQHILVPAQKLHARQSYS